jgi:hypothetical protein
MHPQPKTSYLLLTKTHIKSIHLPKVQKIARNINQYAPKWICVRLGEKNIVYHTKITPKIERITLNSNKTMSTNKEKEI